MKTYTKNSLYSKFCILLTTLFLVNLNANSQGGNPCAPYDNSRTLRDFKFELETSPIKKQLIVKYLESVKAALRLSKNPKLRASAETYNMDSVFAHSKAVSYSTIKMKYYYNGEYFPKVSNGIVSWERGEGRASLLALFSLEDVNVVWAKLVCMNPLMIRVSVVSIFEKTDVPVEKEDEQKRPEPAPSPKKEKEKKGPAQPDLVADNSDNSPDTVHLQWLYTSKTPDLGDQQRTFKAPYGDHRKNRVLYNPAGNSVASTSASTSGPSSPSSPNEVQQQGPKWWQIAILTILNRISVGYQIVQGPNGRIQILNVGLNPGYYGGYSVWNGGRWGLLPTSSI